MIALPPGCTVTYAIWIDVKEMSNDIVDWFDLIGGNVTEKSHYNHRGNKVINKYVQYGKGKPCHYKQDGSAGIRLHFHGDDASAASMFIIKFMDKIVNHNMKEVQERIEFDAN